MGRKLSLRCLPSDTLFKAKFIPEDLIKAGDWRVSKTGSFSTVKTQNYFCP